jgi:glutamine synthetase
MSMIFTNILQLLIEYVQKGDLTVFQAIAMTKDILFNNSNVLYDLRYQATFDETIQEGPKQLTYNTKPATGSSYPSPSIPPIPPAGSTTHPAPTGPIDPRSGSPYEPPNFPPPPTVPHVYDNQVFDSFMKENPDVRFVYVQWLDYMATIRARVVPIKEFTRMIREGDRIGISQGNTGTLQNDTLTSIVNTTGQIYVEPDLRSLRRTHNKDPLPSATVLSYWRSESGAPLPSCPRTSLETLINALQYTHSTTLLVGFEIEVTFLSRNTNTHPKAPQQETFLPLTTTHAWGTMTPEQWLQFPFLAEIVTALDAMDIEIQQFHAESGPGQFEFILPPHPPLLAIDTLVQARQVIAQIAALHGYRATLHPKPFESTGTAAHAHISLHPPDHDMAFFVGGVLKHLPAICAFSMPDTSSYGRVVDDAWTGGTWVAWGTQNREVPLRRIKDGRWEIRCADGLANMYFAMAAMIGAGLLGLQSGTLEYAERDLDVNPSRLDEEGRARYGVTRRMPRSLQEAMEALKVDAALREILDHELVDAYAVMKDAEQRMLGGMGEEERREWMIERY